jgi:abnormal spindle-like microcephaly-associated protein
LPIFEETQSSKISVRTRLEERAKQKVKQLVYERENYHFDAVTTSSPQPNSSKKCHPLQVSQATTTHSPKLNVLTDNLEDVIAQVHVEPRSVSRNDTNHAASDRQCQVFSNWLNHILKPVTDLQLEYQHAVNACSSRSGDIVQPFFGDHQEYARYNANSLFNSSEFLHIRTALATEIARGTLAIRSDRDVFADVSLRGQMLDMLLSYSPAWLRLGLETIFQEKLSMKNLLRNFYDQCHSRQSLGLLPLESQKVNNMNY